MNINVYFSLALISIIPVVVSVLLYIVDYTYLKETSYIKKQIVFGVLFGILSILGTEFGFTISGATINVRDSAPIITGLVFGGLSGIIAGTIGGIERWFAVLWGAGEYTRLACSISTILAGVFSCVLRRYIFDNKIAKTAYAFTAGVIIEVIHMTMIFFTNLTDPVKAFDVIKICTIPMVATNSLAIGLAVYLIHLFRRKVNGKKIKKTIDINRTIQRKMLMVVVVAFIATTSFTSYLQNAIAYDSVETSLSENIEDVINDVEDANSTLILASTQHIVDQINDYHEVIDAEYLTMLAKENDVSEINIINRDGIVTISTFPANLNYDMAKGENSKKFLCLFDGINYYAQPLLPKDYDESIKMKYAAIKLVTGNIVHVGYSETQYYDKIADDVKQVAKNRHIGSTGGLIIIEEETDKIVSDNLNRVGKKLHSIFPNADFNHLEDYERNTMSVEGYDYFYMYAKKDGYVVVAYQEVSEALAASTLSTYLSGFNQVIVFAGIFIVIFIVVNNTVVSNIKQVNKELAKITDGELNTIVNVKKTREFESLSAGINAMVDKLKELIHESEEKMRKELEYAAEIQRAALPSTWPAFPENDEIDIYASMDPAKEVGGDFYDFYFIGENKLAFLVADVSGKGIPASLFMMRAKTIIKTYAMYGISVNDIFTNVNYNLCEGNDAGLFVTCFMGIIDLFTGHITYANAGHNPPLIKKPNGEFEYLRTKPGFVLGGMEGMTYKLYEMDIEPGSEVFVYSDGLTEAQNLAQELYGEDRLLESINNYTFDSSENVCKHITKDVETFVGEADQFDDLTMLHLKFFKKTETKVNK